MPKLIPDVRLAWRFGSVQAALLLALLSGIQAEVLPLFAPLFSADVWPWVSGLLALAVVLLRLVAQPELERDRDIERSRYRMRDAEAAFQQELAEFGGEVDQVLAWGEAEKQRSNAAAQHTEGRP